MPRNTSGVLSVVSVSARLMGEMASSITGPSDTVRDVKPFDLPRKGHIAKPI